MCLHSVVLISLLPISLGELSQLPFPKWLNIACVVMFMQEWQRTNSRSATYGIATKQNFGPPSHMLMGLCKLMSSMLFFSSKVKLTCGEGHTVQQHAPPHHCLNFHVLLQVGAAATVGLSIATRPAVSAEVHLAPKSCLQCTLLTDYADCLAAFITPRLISS